MSGATRSELIARRLEQALEANPRCGSGLLVGRFAFHVARGPSGGEEALVLIHADDVGRRYWYGHALKHPSAEGFVAVLVWTTALIDAGSVPLLFRRFDYWIRMRGEYEPCTIQSTDDAFCRTRTFDEAIEGLARIIARFDLEKRWPDDDGPTVGRIDFRVIDIYGMEDHTDEDGFPPPVPMPPTLRLAKDQR